MRAHSRSESDRRRFPSQPRTKTRKTDRDIHHPNSDQRPKQTPGNVKTAGATASPCAKGAVHASNCAGSVGRFTVLSAQGLHGCPYPVCKLRPRNARAGSATLLGANRTPPSKGKQQSKTQAEKVQVFDQNQPDNATIVPPDNVPGSAPRTQCNASRRRITKRSQCSVSRAVRATATDKTQTNKARQSRRVCSASTYVYFLSRRREQSKQRARKLQANEPTTMLRQRKDTASTSTAPRTNAYTQKPSPVTSGRPAKSKPTTANQ